MPESNTMSVFQRKHAHLAIWERHAIRGITTGGMYYSPSVKKTPVPTREKIKFAREFAGT